MILLLKLLMDKTRRARAPCRLKESVKPPWPTIPWNKCYYTTLHYINLAATTANNSTTNECYYELSNHEFTLRCTLVLGLGIIFEIKGKHQEIYKTSYPFYTELLLQVKSGINLLNVDQAPFSWAELLLKLAFHLQLQWSKASSLD